MTSPMIGYLYNYPQGLQGTPGMAYDYILASNGLFLQAQGNLIQARMKVTDAVVRGLQPLTEQVTLVHGLIPSYFLAQALQRMRGEPEREIYTAITALDRLYRIHWPEQDRTAASVRYQTLPDTVLDLHSHGTMPARFSVTDDQDDQGFRISGVIGRLHQKEAEFTLRLGIYGYHFRISYLSVFSGAMPNDLREVDI